MLTEQERLEQLEAMKAAARDWEEKQKDENKRLKELVKQAIKELKQEGEI